jgi:hypothetical protein
MGVYRPDRPETVLENNITRTIVTIARLADRADIGDHLGIAQLVFKVDLFWRVNLAIFGDDAWNMSMPVEAVAIDEPEQPLHFPMVVDVFMKNVFAHRIAWRAVDEQKRADSVRPGPLDLRRQTSVGRERRSSSSRARFLRWRAPEA